MPKPRPRKRRNHINNTQREHAFYRAGHDAQSESLGVVLVPGLDVEGEEGGKEDEDGGPGLAEGHGAGEEEDFDGGVEGVDAWGGGGCVSEGKLVRMRVAEEAREEGARACVP